MIGRACSGFGQELRAGDLGPAPDELDLLRYVSNAVRRYVNTRNDQGARLWTRAKPAPSLKIDRGAQRCAKVSTTSTIARPICPIASTGSDASEG